MICWILFEIGVLKRTSLVLYYAMLNILVKKTILGDCAERKLELGLCI